MQRLVLPLPGNEAFAAALAAACASDCGRVETRRFPDGESCVRLHGDPAGRAVDLVCSLARPDETFLTLVFAADAARELGAREVNVIGPYLACMRQDMRFQPGEAVSSHSFARLLSTTFDRLLTVDPHLHRHPALAGLYSSPTTCVVVYAVFADDAWNKLQALFARITSTDAVAHASNRIALAPQFADAVRHGRHD